MGWFIKQGTSELVRYFNFIMIIFKVDMGAERVWKVHVSLTKHGIFQNNCFLIKLQNILVSVMLDDAET